MNVEIKHAPSGTIAVCHLNSGENLISEGGALVAMKGRVNIETSTQQKSGGGLWQGIKRLASGESFFLNKYSAQENAQVWLGTPLPGDIMVRELSGEKLIIQGGSYIACEPGVAIDLEWQGLKSLFSGSSIFWVKAKGKGQVLVGSFGFIYPVQVQGEYIVDTSHIVAFEETLNFEISKASQTWLQAFLSGEGFICKFKGQGTVWCASHNSHSYGSNLTPYLKVKRK